MKSIMEQIFDLPKLFVLEVVASIVCGAIIGFERELRGNQRDLEQAF